MLFSRRPSARFHRGRLSGKTGPAGVPGVIQFHTLVSSVPVLCSVQSDLGITLNGSGVSAWADQTGNGRHYSQGTAAKQPLYTAAAVNGFPIVTFDGADDSVGNVLDLPPPGTTSTFVWWLFRIDTWLVSEVQAGTSNYGCGLGLTGGEVTPRHHPYNGSAANSNNGSAVGSLVRGEVYFSNSAADYYKIGSVISTHGGAGFGNADPAAGYNIGQAGAGTVDCQAVSMLAIMHCAGLPTVAERNALNSAVTTKYAGLVGV